MWLVSVSLYFVSVLQSVSRVVVLCKQRQADHVSSGSCCLDVVASMLRCLICMTLQVGDSSST
jgi:hypothetical protein